MNSSKKQRKRARSCRARRKPRVMAVKISDAKAKLRSVPLWLDLIAAGVAVAAYGIYFSMPVHMLFWPVLIGMVAHAARWGVMTLGLQAAPAAGLACLLVGCCLVPISRRSNVPFAAVGFASVVSMIPGVFVFRMGSGLLPLQQHREVRGPLIGEVLSDGLTAFFVVFAMTVGLMLPKLMYVWFRNSRHLVD